MAVDPKLRYLYVVWAFLECILFGGLLYGWGSLVFILIEDGVYSELCDGYILPTTTTEISNITQPAAAAAAAAAGDGDGDQNAHHMDQKDHTPWNQSCPARDTRFALVFTIASALLCVGTAAMGQLNYKYGTRITRLCALVMFTFGALLTGFTSHDLPWLIFPGLTFLGIGGMPLLVTNTQFSMLFNRGSSTVVSLLSGAFDSSSGVTLIIKLLHERGIPLRTSMLVICGAHIVTLISTFSFLPEGFISKAVPKPITMDVEGNRSDISIIGKGRFPAEDSVQERGPLVNEPPRELPSIRSCVLSPLYLLHVMWMSILQLRFFYFLGSLNTWLNSLFTSKDDVSFYTNVCQYAMLCGVASSFLAGIVFDINKKIFDASRSQLRRDLMPAVIPQVLTTVLGVALSVLVLTDTTSTLLPTFIINVIFRSFIYSLAAAYLGAMFPSEYFGVLYGLMVVLCGMVGTAQYALFSWSQSLGYTSVNIFLVAFLTLSLIHPLYQWISCRRAESAMFCRLS